MHIRICLLNSKAPTGREYLSKSVKYCANKKTHLSDLFNEQISVLLWLLFFFLTDQSFQSKYLTIVFWDPRQGRLLV